MAVIYIDGQLPEPPEGRHLTCYGAFEVVIQNGDPVFTSHHVSTTDSDRRTDMIGDLGAMSQGRYMVLGASEAQETFWDRRHILEAGLTYLDMVSLMEDVEPAGLSLMGVPEQALIELASTFGLGNCYSTSVLGQARCAGARAQLVWLAYVALTFEESESQKLFAAFQA